jgi:RNA polymerase sigma factor for flagellar operon FliA
MEAMPNDVMPQPNRGPEPEPLACAESGRQQRVLAHLSLVRREARRIARRLPEGVDADDLVSAGTLGLMGAVDRFEPDRGLSFAAYALHRIRGAILDELRTLDTISRRRRRRRRDLEQVRHQMTGELGRPPEDEALAERLGISLEQLNCERDRTVGGAPLSLDALCAGGLRLSDSDGHPPPDRQLLRREQGRRLRRAIDRLPRRERAVIRCYYEDHLAYRQIAARFGVSESRICQIHRSAIRRIRSRLAAEERGGSARLH